MSMEPIGDTFSNLVRQKKATFIFEIEYAKQGYRAVYIRKDFEQLFAGLCIMSSFRFGR